MSRISQMLFGEHDQFDIYDMDADKRSLFGNYVMDIYDEDIEALKAGKKLVFVDEYGYILVYKPGKKPEPKEPYNYISEEILKLKRNIDGSIEYPYDFSEVD